jgi:hypothetical protein
MIRLVIPAKAGNQEHRLIPVLQGLSSWVPAFAGMTVSA